MKVYRGKDSIFVDRDDGRYRVDGLSWDDLFTSEEVTPLLDDALRTASRVEAWSMDDVLAPVHSQEVWASGVTYLRSRHARIEESKEKGGGDFYDRVYEAERPELFFKAAGYRVVGHRQGVRVRRDSTWSVPEPELALAVNAQGRIIGYTIGNDMSARDIEGENPLYLPQAKVYDQSCALGPALLLGSRPLPRSTEIAMAIARGHETVFEDRTTLAAMKRSPDELVAFLYRENTFPYGCFLLTGTGIVPPDAFSLRSGDAIRITIDPIGTLENHVI